MSLCYVFDANFFFFLSKAGEKEALSRVLEALESASIEPHITRNILQEISYVRTEPDQRSYYEMIKAKFNIHHIGLSRIKKLALALGPENAPGVADLGLMVLAQDLSRSSGIQAHIVTDDFKICTSSRYKELPFKVDSPAGFLLYLLKCPLTPETRVCLENIYLETRKQEINYIIERSLELPAEPKLSWLMDNLIESQLRAGTEVLVEKPRAGQYVTPEEIAHLNRWLLGEKVDENQLIRFHQLLPGLEILKLTPRVVNIIREAINSGQPEKARQEARSFLAQLMNKLQTYSAKVEPDERILLRWVYAHHFYQLNALAAFVHFTLGEMASFEERLDDAALYALMTQNFKGIVYAYYFKSILYTYQGRHDEAKIQYQTTSYLADHYQFPHLATCCLIGKAISVYFLEERMDAVSVMRQVAGRIEGRECDVADPLKDFALHLFHFGLVEMALSVFCEALECAVESHQDSLKDEIMDYIKECHLTLGDNQTKTLMELSELIDMANYIGSQEERKYFETQLASLKNLEERLKSALDFTTESWTAGRHLPAEFLEPFSVKNLHLIKKGEQHEEKEATLLVCYSHKLGNIGIFLPWIFEKKTIARLRLKLSERGQFKVFQAPEDWRKAYHIRGFIEPESEDHLEFAQVISMEEGLAR